MADLDIPQWHTLLQDRIYMIQLNSYLTQEQLGEIDQHGQNILSESSADLVHFLYDTHATVAFPSLNELMTLKFPYHPRIGYGIVIGHQRNPMTRMMFTMLTGIFRARVVFVSSLSEACDFLSKKDPNLPPSTTWHMPPDSKATQA